MTINELVFNVRNQIKQAKSDDLAISDRHIEFMINYLREKLITQQIQKGRSISSNITQDLGQVELQQVDQADGTIVIDKPILRTVRKVPQPVEVNQKDLFTYVGGLDKHSPISYKTKANVKWNKYNKYASKEKLAYYKNGYIYLTNCPNPNLKWINIEGVFSNPREVHSFQFPNGTPCYNPDVDRYPISGSMVDTINDLLKNKELNIFLQVPEDITNNGTANI